MFAACGATENNEQGNAERVDSSNSLPDNVAPQATPQTRNEPPPNLVTEPAENFTYFFINVDEGLDCCCHSNFSFLSQSGLILTAYHGDLTQVRVPDTIDGFPIVGIESSTFKVGVVTEVFFPDTVEFFLWGELGSTVSPHIIVPYGVTRIIRAMGGVSGSIRSVEIPETVRVISDGAFSCFASLTDITIPYGVVEIGTQAFNGCTSLLSINIADSVSRIGHHAFAETSWFNAQPDGLVYAGLVAYTWKGEMPPNTTITLKEGTIGVAEHAFSYQENLISVTIPDSVVYICNFAFSRNESLVNVTIPESVTHIGNGAFSDTPSLSEESRARILQINPNARFE
jgi:hypothetical protein